MTRQGAGIPPRPAGARTVQTMPPSETDADEELDPKEALVDVLKSAIPSGFCKEGSKVKVELGKWWRPGEERKSATTSSTTRSALRRFQRSKGKQAEAQIAQWKASGTRWWVQREEKKSPVDWFDMPSTELTDDVKRDLQVLSMRGAFHPKKHYKNLDRLEDAKWIQIGTVMDHPLDGSKGRLPHRLRKRTLTQQWMADPEMGPALRKQFSHLHEEEEETERLRSKQYPFMTRRSKRRR